MDMKMEGLVDLSRSSRGMYEDPCTGASTTVIDD